MGDTIKLKKGLKAKLPTLGLAEPGFVTDEERLYIGGVNGNVAVPNQKDINDLNTKIQTNKTEFDNKITDVKSDINNAKYTDELIQETNIFTIGKGKNALNQDVDVSQSVVNGQLSDVNLSGRTYPNLVKNSNLKDGLSGWIHSGTHSTESIVGGYLRSTKNTHRPYVGRLDRNDIPTNSKLYIAFIARGNKEGRVMFRLHSNGFATDNVGSQPFTVNTTDTYCNTIITNLLPVNGFSFDGDSYTLEGDYIEIKKPIIINLTQLYGVGNEPTLSECNRIFNYIDRTKSTVSATRIKTMGKNLFNMYGDINYYPDPAYKPPRNYIDGDTLNLGAYTTSFTGRGVQIQLKPSTDYIISLRVSEKNLVLTTYDNTEAFTVNDRHRFAITSNTLNIGVRSASFKTPESGKVFLSFITYGSSGGCKLSEIQLEEGAKVTPYEPYKESITYVSAKDETGKIEELHSLQYGIATTQIVRDEVNIVQGESLKRVKKYILQESDILSVADRDGIYTVVTRKFIDNLPWSNEPKASALMVENYPIATFTINKLWYVEENIGKYFTQNDQTIRFLFPFGTTLPQAKAQLVGTTIYYQLAEPRIYDLDLKGSLESFPNGTIYIDPYIRDSFKYSTNIVLPYPVSQIDKITTLKNGGLVEVDLSTVTLAPDNRAVTITGATVGQAYNIDAPIKQEESTRGTIKYKAPLNTTATLMDVNAKTSTNTKDIITLSDKVNLLIVLNS